jgi:hypothetical protein
VNTSLFTGVKNAKKFYEIDADEVNEIRKEMYLSFND